jgi:hypothetical protein
MANPNHSVLELHATYGESTEDTPEDGQTTNIYHAESYDSDEIDHKYVYGVGAGGVYVELAHYASVKQVVIQNISTDEGSTFYVDGTTGALIPDRIDSGEHISICDPDVVTGIMVYGNVTPQQPDPQAKFHLAICGRKD